MRNTPLHVELAPYGIFDFQLAPSMGDFKVSHLQARACSSNIGPDSARRISWSAPEILFTVGRRFAVDGLTIVH